MCVTTSRYEISGKNSHLLSQKVFLRSIIYPSEKTIHWNKQHFGMRYRPPPLFLHYVSTIKHLYWSSSIVCCCCCVFNLIFALFLFLFISHYLKKLSVDPVHDRGSMDPFHESGPWTRSKVEVHGPLVHVLSSPYSKTHCCSWCEGWSAVPSPLERYCWSAQFLLPARRGRLTHMKGVGMLVVLLRGVNFRFWSRLECSGKNTIIFSGKSLF